jgi:FkbM family methyltransferase
LNCEAQGSFRQCERGGICQTKAIPDSRSFAMYTASIVNINRTFDDYDNQTIQVMQRILKQDSNCVDVGCHVGALLKHMIKFSPSGLHYAFEPLPDYFDYLCERFGDVSSIKLSRLALSDSPGRRSFQFVASNPAYSGFLRRRYDRPHETVIPTEVDTAKLDDVVPQNISIDFIKIDVEGAELEVLRGGLRLLKRDRPFIVFEHGLGAADCYGTTPDAIYHLLTDECGMKIGLMTQWLRDSSSCRFTLEEFSEEYWEHRNFYFIAFD